MILEGQTWSLFRSSDLSSLRPQSHQSEISEIAGAWPLKLFMKKIDPWLQPVSFKQKK